MADTCKCPFCGSEVKNEVVKRLKAQGIPVTLAEMELIQQVESLQQRVFSVEQELREVSSRNPFIGGEPQIGCSE